MELLIVRFYPASCYFIPLGPNILLITLCSFLKMRLRFKPIQDKR
jgi:hypothetical protein